MGIISFHLRVSEDAASYTLVSDYTIPAPPPPVPLFLSPQMFAAGGKKGKGADKEGAARFKKDIITYKNQALQPVSARRGW